MKEIGPLERVTMQDGCKFSFGPGEGIPSEGRCAYPAAIAGVPLVMCISAVPVAAPMSRKALEALGAVPDVHADAGGP